MAGPKRWPWKNAREIKNQYSFTYWTNFVIGCVLTSPFAIWVGRRSKHYQGGVPIVPQQRWIHDFINVDPGH
jgi:predicted nucleic acid-binding protein